MQPGSDSSPSLASELGDGRGVSDPAAYMDALDQLPVTRSPADVHVVVGGGAGLQSMVALPLGYSRGQWQPL